MPSVVLKTFLVKYAGSLFGYGWEYCSVFVPSWVYRSSIRIVNKAFLSFSFFLFSFPLFHFSLSFFLFSLPPSLFFFIVFFIAILPKIRSAKKPRERKWLLIKLPIPRIKKRKGIIFAEEKKRFFSSLLEKKFFSFKIMATAF